MHCSRLAWKHNYSKCDVTNDIFYKNGAIPGLFSLFSSFEYTADSKQMLNKYINFCR